MRKPSKLSAFAYDIAILTRQNVPNTTIAKRFHCTEGAIRHLRKSQLYQEIEATLGANLALDQAERPTPEITSAEPETFTEITATTQAHHIPESWHQRLLEVQRRSQDMMRIPYDPDDHGTAAIILKAAAENRQAIAQIVQLEAALADREDINALEREKVARFGAVLEALRDQRPSDG